MAGDGLRWHSCRMISSCRERANLDAPRSMFARVGQGMIVVARASLLAAIVIASAAYGLTRETSIAFFNAWMGWTFIVWLGGIVISWRWPRVPLLVIFLAAGVLAIGWVSTGLSWLDTVWSMTATNYPAILDDLMILFGAIDPDLAYTAMVRTSALLGGFLIAVDLFASAAWSRALFLTLAATATGMVIFFFLQRSIGGRFLLHSNVEERVILSFATFRYWGNAASYLNLCWPLLAALAAHTISGHRARGWVFWLSAALVVFSALFINVSKAGHILGPIGLMLFGGILIIRGAVLHGRNAFRISPQIIFGIGVPISIVVVSLVLAFPVKSWEKLVKIGLAENSRVIAYGHFVKMIPDAGWIGFGPGSFKTVYLDYVADDPVISQRPYWVAHQDYLQTIVEWGYAGTAIWGLFFAFPIYSLLHQAFGRPPRCLDQRDEYAFSWRERLRLWWEAIPTAESPFVATGGVVAVTLTALHSLADFPMQIESLQFYFLLWIALGWQRWRVRGSQRRRTAQQEGMRFGSGVKS